MNERDEREEFGKWFLTQINPELNLAPEGMALTLGASWAYWHGWKARAARAKPVVPDGWIPAAERLPELIELLDEMVKLHNARGTVLTVHVEQIKEMLAAAPKGEV